MKRMLAAVFAAMLLLTACSGGEEGTSSLASEESATPSQAVSQEEKEPSESAPEESAAPQETPEEEESAATSQGAEALTPEPGSDTSYTYQDGVYQKKTGTVVVMVIPKDFSDVEEGDARDQAQKEFAKTAMAPYYDQGYYCIVAMPEPESGNTYDLDKVRDGEEMMVVKRRKDLDPGDNSETGLYDGVNITTKINLKGESLSAYLERQVERTQEG